MDVVSIESVSICVTQYANPFVIRRRTEGRSRGTELVMHCQLVELEMEGRSEKMGLDGYTPIERVREIIDVKWKGHLHYSGT